MSALPKPYEWQVIERNLGTQDPKLYINAKPRLGKTYVGAQWLYDIQQPRNLVVAPLIACPVWTRWLKLLGFEVVPWYLLDRKTFVRDWATIEPNMNVVYVANPAKLLWMQRSQKRKCKVHHAFDAVILDEAHQFASWSAAQSVIARRICQEARFVRLLSGTPASNKPESLGPQLACINPTVWGFTKTWYQNRHLVNSSYSDWGKQEVRNPEEFQKLLNKSMRIYLRTEVFGEDQWQVVERELVMSEQLQERYKRAVAEMLLENSLDAELDLTHTLSRMLRLQQLCAGFLPERTKIDEKDKVPIVEEHQEKIAVVMEDLDEFIGADEKVVLFHRFTWEGDIYQRLCRERGYCVYRIDGSTSSCKRESQIEEFANTKSAVFILQTGSGGVGISLATASHVMFTSQGFSYDQEEQARDRVYSPGLTRTVTYYRFVGTVEMYIAWVLKNKGEFQEAIDQKKLAQFVFGEYEENKGF